MKKHRVRCTNYKCRARKALRKHPDEYVRKQRCFCGGNLVSIEKERRKQVEKQETCYCIAIPFPHREGSMRFCVHHPLADVPATDAEWDDYRSMLETPRSG